MKRRLIDNQVLSDTACKGLTNNRSMGEGYMTSIIIITIEFDRWIKKKKKHQPCPNRRSRMIRSWVEPTGSTECKVKPYVTPAGD